MRETCDHFVDPVALLSGEFTLVNMEKLFLVLEFMRDIGHIVWGSCRETHDPLPHPGLENRFFSGFAGRSVVPMAHPGRIEGIKTQDVIRLVLLESFGDLRNLVIIGE